MVPVYVRGGLQPSADAIRGLFEHPALMESYLAAVDVLVEKLIYDKYLLFRLQVMRYLQVHSSITETSVPEKYKKTQISIGELKCWIF